MKFGMRKPNIKKSIKARTTGKIKRKMKSTINPLYGKKGMGFIKNPKKAVTDKIYHKTSFGIMDIFNWLKPKKNYEATSSKTVKTKITLEDVDKMNDIEKTQLYHSISVQYKDFYDKYYNNMQKANEYYSLFINNALQTTYFEKMLGCCNFVFENVEQFRNLEMMNNKITGSTDIVKTNSAYTVLAKAYEKLGEYEKAIKVCKDAIQNDFTNDGTKMGFEGRIKKLEKKII